MRLILTRNETRFLRTSARTLAIGSSLLFSYIAISQGPPVPPEGPGIERDVQYIFLVVGILATALSWVRPASGGFLMLFSGLVLGVAASMRYSAETALFVSLLYVIPGSLFLAAWASRRPPIVQFATLGLVVTLMVYGGLEAQARHARAFGPAHPESPLAVTAFDKVEWVWSGGVTSTSASVVARLTDPDAMVRLVAAEEPLTIAQPTRASETVTANQDGIASFSLQGLEPGRTYFYALEVNGRIDLYRTGAFTTFPTGPSTFAFAVGSCARTGSNGAVFDAIRALDPLLYIVPGDFHYENIISNDSSAFQRAYQKVLTSPAQSTLYGQVPIAYVWDDHDFGGNNSDGRSAAREAALSTYETYVPHYKLEGEGIYQAFSVGRVRFVMTDTRSQRNLETRPDGSRSLLGSAQLDWLKKELEAASASHALVVWVNAVPWVGDSPDGWGAYREERREIAEFIANRGINNLLMVSGDAHMVAIDDGTNTNYSSKPGGGFPLLHAAALDRPGSVKGGPYSHGAYPGAGQFGLVEVEDDGEVIQVRLSGRNWKDEKLLEYSFSLPAPVAASSSDTTR